jgi:hypothetical protein
VQQVKRKPQADWQLDQWGRRLLGRWGKSTFSFLRVLRVSVRAPFNAEFFSHRDTKNTEILNALFPLIPPCSPCLRERPIQRGVFLSQRH